MSSTSTAAARWSNPQARRKEPVHVFNHVKLAVAQMGATQDVAENLTRIIGILDDAATEDVDIVVLPECVVSGYMYEDRADALSRAVTATGPELANIARVCRERQLHAVVGLLEKGPDGNLYNTAILIDDVGQRIGHYRKTHLPCLGVDRFVDRGIETPPVIATKHGNIGLAICYDLRFPETARSLALSGADIIAQPSTWPAEAAMLAEHFVPVRACENRVFVAVANRPDEEAGVSFMGRSQIAAPNGQRIAEADGESEGLLTAVVDLGEARDKRIVNVPGEYEVSLFADRRPDLYGRITEKLSNARQPREP
jgi:5-aminopentanamidase